MLTYRTAAQCLSLLMAAGLTLFGGAATSAQAQQTYTFEMGARYWYSQGKDELNLKDTTGARQVSRLTWTSMTGNSAEIFGLASYGRFFLKGYVGGGRLSTGNLQDEDYSPFITPYSSTTSDAKGDIAYASIDLGYNVIDQKSFKLGGFVGYHTWRDNNNAQGCAQTAGNASVCGTPISNAVYVDTESYRWDAIRLGVSTDYRFAGGWRFQGDAAFARAMVQMDDTHWLRQGGSGGFDGSTPTDGSTNGVQLEGTLSYSLTPSFSMGVGARYWKYYDTNGLTHFEQSAIPAGTYPAQHSTVTSERYGLLMQGAYKF